METSAQRSKTTTRFKNPTVKKLLEEYKPLYALDHAESIMDWDLETYMPKEGTEGRSVASSQITLIHQKFFLDDNFKNLVLRANEIDGLNDYERGVVRVLNRTLKVMNLPPKLLEEQSIASTKAFTAWQEAREKSDFKLFAPHLDDIIRIQREMADKLGYEKHPYDALADLYEEGMTVEKLDKIFSNLIPVLGKILGSLDQSSPFVKSSKLEQVPYNKEQMRIVNEELLKLMGFDFGKFRMDVSAHPFTIAISPSDVRITTRYEGVDFKKSMSTTIHEAGHAIYNLQMDPLIAGTPLFAGTSFGIHESQSGFLENMIGRSREFVHLVTPMLKNNFGFLEDYTEEDLYYYFNTVKRTPIRTEADELTYNFHIALRYELEKAIMDGKVSTNELPELWNSRMEDYLGIRPKDDKEGILQDVHWTDGFGYFPTYSLGNIVAGVIIGKAKKEIQDFDKNVRAGNLMQIKEWLRVKIHRFGGVYAPQELLRRSFDEDYNPNYLTDYLEKKYLHSG